MHIDARQIKETASMREVLENYGIERFKPDGSYVGVCLLHEGDNPTAFHAKDNVWYCSTGCGRGGSVIDFVALKEGLSFYEAVQRLADMFGVNESS